jgi:PTS system galactitol-specific IIC component
VNISAAMYLLPVVVNVLVSGLTMVKDHVIKKLKEWFPKRTFYIGMDTALLIDDAAVLTTGLLLIPLILLLTFILPGNKVLPFVDLASLSFLFALVAPFCKRNIFRMLVAGVLISIVMLYCGTATSDAFRVAGHMAHIAAVDKFSAVTALVSPITTWVGWLFVKIGQLLAAVV